MLGEASLCDLIDAIWLARAIRPSHYDAALRKGVGFGSHIVIRLGGSPRSPAPASTDIGVGVLALTSSALRNSPPHMLVARVI